MNKVLKFPLFETTKIKIAFSVRIFTIIAFTEVKAYVNSTIIRFLQATVGIFQWNVL